MTLSDQFKIKTKKKNQSAWKNLIIKYIGRATY